MPLLTFLGSVRRTDWSWCPHTKMAFVPALPVVSSLAQHGTVTGNRRIQRTVTPARRSATVRRGAPTMILGKTIGETLKLDCMNPSLLALADAAGVDLESVSGTLFAPSETAFKRLPKGAVEWLCERPEIAKAILLRHILPDTVTTKQISGVGYFSGVDFGPELGYEGLGAIVKVGGQPLYIEKSNRECSNGIIHAIDGFLLPPGVKLPAASQLPAPAAVVGDSTVSAVYPSPALGRQEVRAKGAAYLNSTQGGRRAMGLVKQLPFWMYGPPYMASKQDDYEPISAAVPAASVDYQLMPPGSVVVTPDEVSAAKLIPVSGLSKYIGKGKRQVEGDAESSYAERLGAGY